MKKNIFIFVTISLIFTLLSCSPELSIKMKNDNTSDFYLNLTNTESFFANFSAFMDFNEEKFYDEKSLIESLTNLGFSKINLTTGKNADLSISAEILNNTLVNSESPLSTLFSITDKDFALEIHPSKLIEILSSVPEISDYLDLLMAPIYTGEQISESEYLELFASVYGESFAQDFEKTNISININTLNKIKDIQSSENGFATTTFTDKKANIKIPFYKLLCKQDVSVFKIIF